MAYFPPASRKINARLRARWHSVRLDMTPLVDVAFLLLSFFILQAAYAKSPIIQLSMPAKGGYYGRSRDDLHEYGAITIMLGRHHRLYYYYGLNSPLDHSTPLPEVKTTDFSAQGIRQVLLSQREPSENVVFIKPTPQAAYQDMIDILDEMNITNQKKYALVDISASDIKLLSQAGY